MVTGSVSRFGFPPEAGGWHGELRIGRLRSSRDFDLAFEGGNRLKVSARADVADLDFVVDGEGNEFDARAGASARGLTVRFGGRRNKVIIEPGAVVYGVKFIIDGDGNVIIIRRGARLQRCTICIGGNTDAGNFQGHENRIVVGRDSHLTHTKIEFRGSQNVLEIGERVYVVHHALFLLHGHRCEIRVGEGTSIQKAFLSAGECGARITIGRDCMLAHGVVIATTDQHAVLEDSTGRRINPAASVYVGDHVWLCDGVRLAKGAAVGDGCVVGCGALVLKPIADDREAVAETAGADVAVPEQLAKNAEIVGSPARVVKRDIKWVRGRIMDGDAQELSPDALAESRFTRGCERIGRGAELLELAKQEQDPESHLEEAERAFEEAVGAIQEAVEVKPDYVYAHSALGNARKYQAEIAMRRNRMADYERFRKLAQNAFGCALLHDPTHGDSIQGMGEVRRTYRQAS